MSDIVHEMKKSSAKVASSSSNTWSQSRDGSKHNPGTGSNPVRGVGIFPDREPIEGWHYETRLSELVRKTGIFPKQEPIA